jgi:hypothetical protein
MQRDFSRLEQGGYSPGLVDFDRDFLSAREHVVFRESIAVRDLIGSVRAGHELHGAIRLVARRDRDPCGYDIGLVETPVGRILVPRHERRRARFLDEEAAGPAQQVGSVQVFHRIENSGVPHDIGEPRKEEMRLRADVAL